MLPGVGNGIGSKIDARRVLRALSQFRRAVSGSATDVEHPGVRGEPRGVGVARQMLSPEVVVHLTGDDSLSRELAHGIGTPALILAFTSTRHRKWSWPYTGPSEGSICRASALSIQSQMA